MKKCMQSVCFILGSPVRTRTWIEYLTDTCSAIELQENSVKSLKNVLLTICCVNCHHYYFNPCRRDNRIWTCDLMFPKHARYQTAPYPEYHNQFLCFVLWFLLWRMVSNWDSFNYLTWGRASGFLYLSLLVVCKMFSLNYAPSQCSSSLPIRDLNPFTRNLLSLVF